jgi:hypothetical protein
MLPGSEYVLALLIILANVGISAAVGLIANLIMYGLGCKNDGFFIDDPSDTYVIVIRWVSLLIAIIVFYGLSPVMVHCIRWGMAYTRGV